MALSPEWKTQIDALGYAELTAEIDKEETGLGLLYESLYDADKRLEEVIEELKDESELEDPRLWLGRQKTIARLTRKIEEKDRQIASLSEEAHKYERRALDPYTSLTSKIIFLETAATLWRTVRAFKGWRTRYIRSRRTYRSWQTKKAPLVERLRTLLAERATWEKEAQTLANQIKIEEARIAYKKSILPEITLSRVSLALYLIIDAGEHVYPRDGGHYTLFKPHYRKVRHNVKYPKGRFQSILECDAFTDPSTGEIRRDLDPFKTLEDVMRAEVADEFMEEFSLKAVKPNDLTLGETSIIPDTEEIGKPPYKISISRTSPEEGREWKTMIQRYIMTDSEYLALTREMTDYLKSLEEMME